MRRLAALTLLLAGCLSEESAGPLDWGAIDAPDAAVVEEAGAPPVDAAIDGSAPLVDAGAEPDATLLDPDSGPHAFQDAGPYASKPVARSAKEQMVSTGTVPTKTACLACHNGATAPAWLTGGTVFRDVAGTQGAADIEVRIVDMLSGTVFSVHSDVDGNFWIPKPTSNPSGPFLIGVRDGDQERHMPLLQRGLDCNGSACHGGAQGPIHLP